LSSIAASIEFARGCPWDCTFCSAWTFYGRSYRTASPELVAEELAGLAEPGVFIVDDVAFIHAEHAMAIAETIRRRGIHKRYYLETRGDVLLRNKQVFRAWRDLGLECMFIGLEAIDEAGLELFRKRIHVDKNFEALEFARSLGVTVAINLIVDPDGTAAASRRSATGAWRRRRSSTSASTPLTRARRSGGARRAASPASTTACSTSSTRCCRPGCRCRNSTPSG
jgi:pyruvate-formate lyase-activating enzyme